MKARGSGSDDLREPLLRIREIVAGEGLFVCRRSPPGLSPAPMEVTRRGPDAPGTTRLLDVSRCTLHPLRVEFSASPPLGWFVGRLDRLAESCPDAV